MAILKSHRNPQSKQCFSIHLVKPKFLRDLEIALSTCWGKKSCESIRTRKSATKPHSLTYKHSKNGLGLRVYVAITVFLWGSSMQFLRCTQSRSTSLSIQCWSVRWSSLPLISSGVLISSANIQKTQFMPDLMSLINLEKWEVLDRSPAKLP